MARWLTLGGYPVRQHNSPNRGGAMDAHKGVVCHIAQGTYLGTISWQMNPDQEYQDGTKVTTSSTWIVGKNKGEIAQMVDTDEIAWCQRGGSRTWLSIEFAGYNTGALTAWQIEAAALILAKVHEVYGVPLQVAADPSERGLGHHSMDREWLGEEWGHDSCPGPKIVAQKPQIVARAIDIAGGDMATPLEIWTHDLLNGPGEDAAYKVLNRAAAQSAEAVALGKANAAALAELKTSVMQPVDLDALATLVVGKLAARLAE